MKSLFKRTKHTSPSPSPSPSSNKPTTPTDEAQFLTDTPYTTFTHAPLLLIIGAGSRGTAYASAAIAATNARIHAVAEPVAYKRDLFGKRFIWGNSGDANRGKKTADSTSKAKEPGLGQSFSDWREWVAYEEDRRDRARRGENVERGVDAVFVCVLDEMHEEVVCGIAGLKLHVCVEKPLSTRLESCVNILRALKRDGGGDVNGSADGAAVNGDEGVNGIANDTVDGKKETVFGICHVLRYSPHNMMLRHLVLEKDVIGDVLSIEHVEPVGWWHFSHSYVRGNWRKESRTAPSLLTKSCHDIDFLLWMLSSPATGRGSTPHLPSYLTSTGSRKFFRKERKPKEAGAATNCLSCAHEDRCDYSAKKIYTEKRGMTGWPVKIVNPEIEEIFKVSGKDAAVKQLLENLSEDYTAETPQAEVEARPWYGRCVYEADNDVCDDQCVTITWDDDPRENDEDGKPILKGRGAKTAQFHMVAFSEKICERRGRIYGTKGEIEYDSTTIKVHNFSTGYTKVHTPHYAGGGHGGGDRGLARQFLLAVDAVDSQGMPVSEAQRKFLGCDLDEAFRSHAMVFAAEDARTKRQVVDWKKWWSEQVDEQLEAR